MIVYRVTFECQHPEYEDAEEYFDIGIYSTREKAQEAVTELSVQPGFRELPEGFDISETHVDVTHWPEGFETVDAQGNRVPHAVKLPSYRIAVLREAQQKSRRRRS